MPANPSDRARISPESAPAPDITAQPQPAPRCWQIWCMGSKPTSHPPVYDIPGPRDSTVYLVKSVAEDMQRTFDGKTWLVEYPIMSYPLAQSVESAPLLEEGPRKSGYVRKPTPPGPVIKAVQWTGVNLDEVREVYPGIGTEYMEDKGCRVGDYVVSQREGMVRFYPADVFHANWIPAPVVVAGGESQLEPLRSEQLMALSFDPTVDASLPPKGRWIYLEHALDVLRAPPRSDG